MKFLRIGVLFLAVTAMTLSAALAQQRPAAEIVSKVKVGDMAPDFTLNDHNNQPVKLSDFKGKKNVVLAFYVLAFTGG
jgi:cytochrome oxidase Cu insertion factor (SCO1/SenC/PrrC family)